MLLSWRDYDFGRLGVSFRRVRLNLNWLTVLQVDVIIGDVVDNVQVLTGINTFVDLVSLAL